MLINKLKRLLARYIEKHYDMWGTKIECDLPPEFVITDHAMDSMNGRFKCNPNKIHKVMVKAWKSEYKPDWAWIREADKRHPKSIYKIFNGFIFVFRLRYNKRLGFSQKFLVTTYKKNGFQTYGQH